MSPLFFQIGIIEPICQESGIIPLLSTRLDILVSKGRRNGTECFKYSLEYYLDQLLFHSYGIL